MSGGSTLISFHEAHPCTSCHENPIKLYMQVQLYMHVLEVPSEKKRQIVLRGAWHLSDYVTKMMTRHSDQSVDPKAVLEFVFS